MNTTNTEKKHYAKRDPESQGIHYINHVSAMTTEGLHAKSAIAAELAHRDIEIERLRVALASPAQPVGWAIFAENGNGLMWTQSRQNAEVSAKNVGLQVTPLYAAPQPAVPAQAATAKQSPHPEYDKGFSDGWNRCEERQAAAPVDADVQQDAERLDFLIEQRAYVVSDPSICDGYWLHYARPNGETWVQSNEHTTPRAAIDAARAERIK